MTSRTHWLPLACFIIIPITFFTSYGLSVGLGHVDFDFPYISDTGAYPPESCIFSQLLNITAALVMLVVYVRYKQVEEYCPGRTNILRANNISLGFGLLAAFGISMVGNFQEVNVLVVHLIGALMAFGFGGIYSWFQTFMSYQMCPEVSSKRACVLRAVMSSIITIGFICTFLFSALAKHQYTGHNPRKWQPEDGGWTFHIVSTASEWTMATAFLCYFLTFYGEFRRIHVLPPQVRVLVSNVVIADSSSSSYGACQETNPLLA